MAKECIVKTLATQINSILEIFDCPSFVFTDTPKLKEAIACTENINLIFALKGFCNEMIFYSNLIGDSCNSVIRQSNKTNAYTDNGEQI